MTAEHEAQSLLASLMGAPPPLAIVESPTSSIPRKGRAPS